MEQRDRSTSQGSVVAIHVAGASGAAMASLDEVEAVAGRGLKGDRYFSDGGPSSRAREPGRQVTLIESEAIEGAAQEAAVDFRSTDSRRNIVTRGVALNYLLGHEFTVGEARLRGVELCEPCAYMIKLSGKKVLRSLVHHGGLRAEVVADGTIRLGDAVETP